MGFLANFIRFSAVQKIVKIG